MKSPDNRLLHSKYKYDLKKKGIEMSFFEWKKVNGYADEKNMIKLRLKDV